MLRLLLLDMDGTVVQYSHGSFQSSWDAIAAAAGIGKEWQEKIRFYISRPHLYDEWFDWNCQQLKGLSVDEICQKIFPPPYTSGFLDCCQTLKQQDVSIALLSSGVDLVAKRVQEDAALDEVVVNEVHTENGRFTGSGRQRVALHSKGEHVRKLMQRYSAHREETAYVGDHFNDIPAWNEVGLPLGMNVKDQRCNAVIRKNFADFHQLQRYLERELF